MFSTVPSSTVFFHKGRRLYSLTTNSCLTYLQTSLQAQKYGLDKIIPEPGNIRLSTMLLVQGRPLYSIFYKFVDLMEGYTTTSMSITTEVILIDWCQERIGCVLQSNSVLGKFVYKLDWSHKVSALS